MVIQFMLSLAAHSGHRSQHQVHLDDNEESLSSYFPKLTTCGANSSRWCKETLLN